MLARQRSVLASLSLALVFAATGQAQFALQRGALPALDQDVQAKLLLNDWTVQALELPGEPGEPFTLSVDLGGETVGLVLAPHSVRSDAYHLLASQADGTLVEQVPGMPDTYQGIVSGKADSAVAASLVDGQLTALIRLAPDQPVWGIQPASKVNPVAPSNLHVVYCGADLVQTDAICGTTDVAIHPGEQSAPLDFAGTGNVVCEIACDADVEFYNLNGSSVPNTESDINAIVNAMELIYENDVGIDYQVTTIIVRTAEADPYSSTNPNTLLNQFRSEWNNNQGGVQRDVAHLFTGKNIDGSVIGIASLSVICSQSNGYGLSQSKYTGNFTKRTALTSHEVGHNWSANHCDGASDCRIMCSGLGGCSGVVTSFGSGAINSINNKKNAVGCLDDAVPPPPPVITAITPATVQAFNGGNITVFGSGFTKSNLLTSGSTQLHKVSGYHIVNDSQIQYQAPVPLALGQTNVTVANPGGTSNVASFSYVETDPVKMTGQSIWSTSFTDPLDWAFGGGANDLYFMLLSPASTTFNYQSQNILLTSFVLANSTLDGVGLGTASLLVPPVAAGLVIYAQVVTLDAGTVKAGPLISTWIFN